MVVVVEDIGYSHMIFELPITVVSSGLAGLAVFHLALTCRRSRQGVENGRLTGVKSRPREISLWRTGGWLMSLMPAGWVALIRACYQRSGKTLVLAGKSEADLIDFSGVRLIFGLGGLALPVLLGARPLPALIIGGFLAIFGQSLPQLWLEGQARERQAELSRLLPDFLGLLAMAIAAGLGLERAIVLCCDRLKNPLTELFRQTMAEIEVGKARSDAFRGLMETTGSNDIALLVGAVLQSEQLGTPLALALKSQAEAGRQRQKEAIRELSAKAPIKMLFPIAGLILPALLIVIMGPAFLHFIG
jgi:Flp pilus assembly protein TadB